MHLTLHNIKDRSETIEVKIITDSISRPTRGDPHDSCDGLNTITTMNGNPVNYKKNGEFEVDGKIFILTE